MSIVSVMLSKHLVLHHPPLFRNVSFPASGSFLMTRLFASGGKSIGALASVLPVNIQGWFPLGLTSLHSSQSKGLSGVNSSTTIDIPWRSTSFMVQVSHSYMTYWINLSSDYRDLCQQSDDSDFYLFIYLFIFLKGIKKIQGYSFFSIYFY